MPFQLTGYNVTTIALIAGALIVIYTRARKWLDSNVPLFYYAIMIAYTNTLEGRLSPWVIYAGLALALLLRFEFMNTALTAVVQTFEFAVLAAIIYECALTLLGR